MHALVELVTAECAIPRGPFVHVRGRHAAGDLAARSPHTGSPSGRLKYTIRRPCPLSEDARARLDGGAIDVVTLYSPRSATLFAAEARANGWDLSAVTTVSISVAADPR